MLPNAAFSRLGYVTFGDNQSHSYRVRWCLWVGWGGGGALARLTNTSCAQTRELKSIPLDVSCQFIKLRFHQNHINHLNPFNQVRGWFGVCR